MSVDLYEHVAQTRGLRKELEIATGRAVQPSTAPAQTVVDSGVAAIEAILIDLQERGFSFWRTLAILKLRRRTDARKRATATPGELYIASLDVRDNNWVTLETSAGEDLRLARAAAAQVCSSGGVGVSLAAPIEDGLADHCSEVQSALAAIRLMRAGGAAAIRTAA